MAIPRSASIACAMSLVALLAAIPGVSADLVRNINAAAVAPSVVPLEPVDLSNITLFALDDGLHGSELWSTDGTPGGTHLVLDINPGPASSRIASLIVAQGVAYFWADDGTNGFELWRSDGTSSGTSIIANVIPDDHVVDGPIAPALRAIGAIVFFIANDGQSGIELWRSDGTRNGTYRLRDINPGAASSSPDNLTVDGSTLFFSADDGSNGQELWSTTGTAESTHLVLDINPGAASSTPRELTVVGTTLFLIAGNAAQGLEVWRAPADGSTASIVQDIEPGAVPSIPRSLMRVGNGIVFAQAGQLYGAGVTGGATALGPLPCFDADPLTSSAIVIGAHTLFHMRVTCDPAHQITRTDIWSTDGTPQSTGPLRPAARLHFRSDSPPRAIAANGEAYFLANASAPGNLSPGPITTIWRSDGTASGTFEVGNFPQGVSTTEIVRLGTRIYFSAGANTDPAGQELWSTDGTNAGTQLVRDIWPGTPGSFLAQMRIARGRLMFSADDGVAGIEPWVSDGTTAGTIRLGDLRVDTGTVGSGATGYFPLGAGALFVADDGSSGRELWFTDGTESGTRRVADIAPGEASSDPSFFVEVNGAAIFEANDGTSGRELWRTDGTTAGTRRIADISPGARDGNPISSSFGALVLGGVAYFAANDATHGTDLWRTDGTTAGTFLLTELSPGPDSSGIEFMGIAGGRVQFVGQTAASRRLWSTDGTAAGTQLLRADMEPGPGSDSALFQGSLYFQGIDTSGDAELWRTDGTATGTVRVRDINPTGSSTPFGFAANSQLMLFTACTSAAGCKLYASRAPATLIEQLSGFDRNGPAISDGSRLIFIDSSSTPNRFVATDGTLSGTRALFSGTTPFNGTVTEYTWFSGSLVFSVQDQALGPSVWASDGTIARTHLLADVDPGKDVGNEPGEFSPIAGKLLFTAFHPSYGLEPWVISGNRPSTTPDSTRTALNTAARIAVLANDWDLSGNLLKSSVEILTAPVNGTATVDSASGEIIYTPAAGRSGLDTLTYRVMNQLGNASTATSVSIIVATGVAQGPGTAPVAPPPTPVTPPAPASGGGGGAFDRATLLLLLLAFCAALQPWRATSRRARR